MKFDICFKHIKNMKFDMYFKHIKNMKFNSQIFKIYSHINLLVRVVTLGYNYFCNQTLKINFGPLNNILGFYKQEKAQKFLFN